MKKENEFTKVEKLVSNIPEKMRNVVVGIALLLMATIGLIIVFSDFGPKFLGSSLILIGFCFVSVYTGVLGNVQRKELRKKIDKIIDDAAAKELEHFNRTGFKTPAEYSAYLKGKEDVKN